MKKKQVVLSAILVFVILISLPLAAFAQQRYTVQRGDTLYSIARRFGTTVAAIQRANGLSGSLIYAGQVLNIPGSGTGSSGSSSSTSSSSTGWTHYVARGETLSSIAYRYGTSWVAVANANGIKSPYVIYVGQRLFVPGAGGRSSSSSASSASAATSSSSSAGVHVVQRGDTLSAIGARYGVDWRAIQATNGLGSSTTIWVGQRLIIPGRNSSGVAQPAHQANSQACSIPAGYGPRNSLDYDPGFATYCSTGNSWVTGGLPAGLAGVVDTTYLGVKYYAVPGCVVYGTSVSRLPDWSNRITCWKAYP